VRTANGSCSRPEEAISIRQNIGWPEAVELVLQPLQALRDAGSSLRGFPMFSRFKGLHRFHKEAFSVCWRHQEVFVRVVGIVGRLAV
jgi:hypothetical protein